ncbi:MAG TPA: hypothetical protein VE504_00740 [Nitrososphaeraceae archaeon]|nr:hypothetical protein [Nitrososphaeraceae archaeon]
MSVNDLTDLLLANIGLIITSFTAGAAATVSYVTYRFQRKKFSLTALAEAFRLLNDVKHREARRLFMVIIPSHHMRLLVYPDLLLKMGLPLRT